MNFLAHIYLSGNNDLLKIGNFMADSIRGKDYLNYPYELQKGILLHRHIDTFTDAHPIYRKSKHRLHDKYAHYSGVIMDIIYDHYLAKNWNEYSHVTLDHFAVQFYELLQNHHPLLTEKVQKMLPTMRTHNWLLKYATLEGLEKILFQMNYRVKHPVNMHEAIVEVQVFQDEFEEEFKLFFQELRAYCEKKIEQL